MGNQLIVSISREFGSGGHEIAKTMAEYLEIKMYDRSMLDEIAKGMNISVEELREYDEKPRNPFLSRKVGKYSNSIEENIAEIQFEYIRRKAASGESFVIVGRCAETVLKDHENLITIFISGDRDFRIKRVEKQFHITEKGALDKIARHDRTRMQYHNRHSIGEWGDARYYDLCVNSAKLGVEKTAKMLETYVRQRIALMD